jgi:uncharacterized protein YkwD
MKRRLTGAVLIALLAVLVGAVPALAFDHSANEAAILKLINHARTSRGMAAVKAAEPLDRAALSHSRDMIARDYFSHSSLAGASVAARARGAGYSTSGCSSWAVGEVIALGSSYKGTPDSIFKGWMRSSAHRQCILSSRWRDVGVGCARGSYRGYSGVLMYTVDFGRRAK